jgi:amidohydrolase
MIDYLDVLIKQIMPQTVADYRYIHTHPELSGQEKQTSEYVVDSLLAVGLTPVEHVGGHGVTAVIEGNGSGRCLGLRADMDALPVKETSGMEWESQNEGVCHACGHDMHTAMLLGTARVLYALKDEFPGQVKLLFQPAEEDVLDPGAPKMIADGCLDNPQVDAIIAQHVWPALATGEVAVRKGVACGSSDRFFITVKGKSCHGSSPNEGVDAIVIAGQLIVALQTIVSRNISALDSTVISIGEIHGGDRYNVIANEVRLEGTCRNLSQELWKAVPQMMERVIKGITEAMSGSYEFRYCYGYAPTINDAKMFELIHGVMQDVIGEENVKIPEHPFMGGEDFSFFAQAVPSVYYWLGCRDPNTSFDATSPLHNGGFIPQEEAMLYGIKIMSKSALSYLHQAE